MQKQPVCMYIARSGGPSCMRMAVEKPNLLVFSYKFQGIFTANVFSELALHTESKMTTFMSGPQ